MSGNGYTRRGSGDGGGNGILNLGSDSKWSDIGQTGTITFTTCYHDADLSKPKQIIFQGMKTIAVWDDGSRTIATCVEGDIFDPEKGVALCVAYKIMEGKNQFKRLVEGGLVQPTKEDKEKNKRLKELNKSKRDSNDEFPF